MRQVGTRDTITREEQRDEVITVVMKSAPLTKLMILRKAIYKRT